VQLKGSECDEREPNKTGQRLEKDVKEKEAGIMQPPRGKPKLAHLHVT